MKNYLITLFICFVFLSCGRSYDESSGESSMDKSILSLSSEQAEISSSMADSAYFEESAADDEVKMEKSKMLSQNKVVRKAPVTLKQSLENLSDTIYLKNVRLSKKFIKTAEFRFKVKNVEKATQKIEKLAILLGGYVQQSQIKSNYISGRTIELSKDSMLTVFEYYVSNQLVVRVPNIYFDSVLNEISNLYIYLDFRDIKTEDVSTTFLRNKLKAEKKAEYEKRIQKASDQGQRRLDDIVEAERVASDMADIVIDKKIENYNLQDRIDFSTLTLDVYQANSVFEEKVVNTTLQEYQPNFWQRAWEAIQTGWFAILTVLIALLYLWPLYLLAIIIYYAIKFFRKKFKK